MPSATTKKKEKISFSPFADMEETATKLYNRVEKLADVFSASRRRRTVNSGESALSANLPKTSPSSVALSQKSDFRRLFGKRRAANGEFPEFGTFRNLGKRRRRRAMSGGKFRNSGCFRKLFAKRRRALGEEETPAEGGEKRAVRLFGRERGVRSPGRVR